MPRKKAQATASPVVENEELDVAVEAEASPAPEAAPEVAKKPSGMLRIRNVTYAGLSVRAGSTLATFDKEGVAELPEEDAARFLKVPGYSLVE